MVSAEREKGVASVKPKIQYTSKLMAALSKFAGALSTEVRNPMLEKHGEAYDYLIQADAHRLREETEDAIRAYEKALQLDPMFIEAYVGMGRCFRRKGDLKRAIATFNKALSYNAFDKDIHVELAKCYNEGGFPSKGIHHFRQALKISPNFTEAKFNLALCLELQGELIEPTSLYQEILAYDPDFLPAYNNLGSIYMRQGLYKAAEEMFRKLIELAPDFSRGHLGLAISLDRSNRPHEALKHYEKLLVMKAHTRNKDYVENRVVNLRRALGRKVPKTTNGTVLVRVK